MLVPRTDFERVCVTLTRYNYLVLSLLSLIIIFILCSAPLSWPPPISTHFISSAPAPHKNSIKYNNIHNSSHFYNRHQSAGLHGSIFFQHIFSLIAKAFLVKPKRQNYPFMGNQESKIILKRNDLCQLKLVYNGRI